MNDLQFTVDTDRCTGCESCVTDCPPGVMAMDGDIPVIRDSAGCMRCMHCYAVCPTGAISILGRNPDDAIPLKEHLPTFEEMRTLIKGRRSVRQFIPDNLEKEDIDRLLQTVWHAPTGHNSQTVQLTVVDDYEKMQRLSADCFSRLGQLAEGGKLPPGPLGDFFHLGLGLQKQQGIDIFFRGAPHMLVTSAPKSAPCPQIDTIIAMAYFELAAQAMHLGTLWNGLVKAMLFDLFPDIGERLGIPRNHHVGYVMVFGRPAIGYQRTVERGPARIHIVSL